MFESSEVVASSTKEKKCTTFQRIFLKLDSVLPFFDFFLWTVVQ